MCSDRQIMLLLLLVVFENRGETTSLTLLSLKDIQVLTSGHKNIRV